MIKIADNPVVREQVKTTAPEAGVRHESTTANGPGPVAPGYPAKVLVLDNGRYYTADIKK